MRRIAIINQKGGVGKTTTTVNLGAALAIQGRRVVLVDMDAQANLSMALGIEAASGEPTSYSVLMGDHAFGACIRATKIPGLSIVPSNIDLSGAELELASAMGREYLLRDALTEWNEAHLKQHGTTACDYVLFDCPPSLGLLSINALAAAGEVLITLQTEFLALQGMSKLLEIITLLKKRLNPDLVVAGIVPSLYDSRLKLAREVLGEIRSYFKDQVVPHPIRANVKLAEAPSFGQTIFEYAPDSNGADDYMKLAFELVSREARDKSLVGLPPFQPTARLPIELTNEVIAPKRVPPPPPKRKAVTPAPATAPAVVQAKAAEPEALRPSSAPAIAVQATQRTPAQKKPLYSPAEPADGGARKPQTPKSPQAKPAPSKDGAETTAAHAAVAPKPGPTKRSEAPKPVVDSAPTRKSAPKSVEITPAAPAAQNSKKHREIPAVGDHKAAPARETRHVAVPTPASVVESSKHAGAKPSDPKKREDKSSAVTSAGLVHPESKKTATRTAGTRIEKSADRPASQPTTSARTPTKSAHLVNDDEIPALPPDAFEILSTPLDP